MPKIRVNAGTMNIPDAIPSIPPSVPAASDIKHTNTENAMLFTAMIRRYLLFAAIRGNASSGRGDWRLRRRVESLTLSPR
jgi:hypothetical protein